MAGNKQHDKKRTTNGEPNEQPGSPAQDPREHDKGRVSGTQGEYDAQRERRREDEQNEINEEPI